MRPAQFNPSENFGQRRRAIVANPAQERCDAIQAAVREERESNERPPLAVSPKLAWLEPSDDVVEQRLAEELDLARRMLDSVGDRLVSDPVMINRHAQALQSFDIIGQMLGHISKVIGVREKEEAIRRVGMADMRARLQRPTKGITSILE